MSLCFTAKDTHYFGKILEIILAVAAFTTREMVLLLFRKWNFESTNVKKTMRCNERSRARWLFSVNVANEDREICRVSKNLFRSWLHYRQRGETIQIK